MRKPKNTAERPQSRLEQVKRHSMFLDRRLNTVTGLGKMERAGLKGDRSGFYFGHAETGPLQEATYASDRPGWNAMKAMTLGALHIYH